MPSPRGAAVRRTVAGGAAGGWWDRHRPPLYSPVLDLPHTVLEVEQGELEGRCCDGCGAAARCSAGPEVEQQQGAALGAALGGGGAWGRAGLEEEQGGRGAWRVSLAARPQQVRREHGGSCTQHFGEDVLAVLAKSAGVHGSCLC